LARTIKVKTAVAGRHIMAFFASDLEVFRVIGLPKNE
jgi:hypothetical protein